MLVGQHDPNTPLFDRRGTLQSAGSNYVRRDSLLLPDCCREGDGRRE